MYGENPLGGEEPISSMEHETNTFKQGGEDNIKNVLNQLRNRAAMARNYWQRNYDEAEADLEFSYGEQWASPGQRAAEDKPTLSMNMMPVYIHRVKGLAEQSKFAIKVRDKSGLNSFSPTVDGKRMLPKNELLAGIIRSIEQNSNAQEAYIAALQDALDGGFGWLWVRTHRVADDPFNLHLKIEHIQDRWSVLFDPYSTDPNLRDADWCIINKEMPRAEFDTRYGHKIATSQGTIRSAVDSTHYSGYTSGLTDASGSSGSNIGDKVRIYRYWRKVPVKRRAYLLIDDMGNNFTVYHDELPDDGLDAVLDNHGLQVSKEDEFNSYKIKLLTCTNEHVLEDQVDWPSNLLPIVPVFGRQTFHNGQRQLYSLIRFSKDPQRMINYWFSSATERQSMSTKAQWLLTQSQIRGHEKMWNSSHKGDTNYLLYNDSMPGKEIGKPIHVGAPDSSSGDLQLMGVAKQFIQNTTGIEDSVLGKKSNETSGKAIQERKQNAETGLSGFFASLESSITSIGNILLDMAPKIYTNQQAIKVIEPDDNELIVQLNREIEDPETGKIFKIGDLGLGNYECVVDVVQNPGTANQMFLEMIMTMVQHNPKVFNAVADMVGGAMDVPFKYALVKRLLNIVPREFLTEQQREMLPPPPPPTPEQQLEAGQIQAGLDKLKIDKQISDNKLEISEVNLDKEEIKLQSAIEESTRPNVNNEFDSKQK